MLFFYCFRYGDGIREKPIYILSTRRVLYSPITSDTSRQPMLPSCELHLASKCRRTWVGVASGNRVVDVDQDTRVGSLVRAREGDKVRGCLAATTSNLKLRARKVKLGSALALSGMDGDVLIAH